MERLTTPTAEQFRRTMALSDAARTARFAMLRCWPTASLLARAVAIPLDPELDAVLTVVEERAIEDEEVLQLYDGLLRLSETGERLKSREKQRVDGAIRRLSRSLPPTEAAQFATKEIRHARKARRDTAARLLKHVGVPPTLAEDILQLYHATGDQQLLELLARAPDIVATIDLDWLLKHLEEPYWRVRAIESALQVGRDAVLMLRHEFPVEFAHAVGRIEARELEPAVTDLLDRHGTDPAFLGIYAWCMGKLQMANRLESLMPILEDLLQDAEASTA